MPISEQLREQFIAKYPQYECEPTVICKNSSEFQTKCFPYYELCDEKFSNFGFGFYMYEEGDDKDPPARLEKLCKSYAEEPDNRAWCICYAVSREHPDEWFILITLFYRRHKWTEDELFEKINNFDLQALLALERLFECQTAEEIASGSTIERNNKGLNGYDANFLTNWWNDTILDRGDVRIGIKTYLTEYRKARQRLQAGERGVNLPRCSMSPKQMAYIKKVLHKYRKQLLQMVNS